MRPLLIVLLLLNTTSLFSQHNWGFKLGYHNSGMQFKTASPDANAISRGSFHAGVFYELAINQNLYLQPAISLYQKGASLIENGNKIDINPVYIEVPLNFLAKFEVADGRIFLGGGPYGSIGVAGSVIANTNVLGYGQGHPIKYGSDEDRHDFKRFDFGINVLTGYEFNKNLSLGAGYSFGTANIWPPSSGSLKKPRYFVFFRNYDITILQNLATYMIARS